MRAQAAMGQYNSLIEMNGERQRRMAYKYIGFSGLNTREEQ
jgi:hypothetical protein